MRCEVSSHSSKKSFIDGDQLRKKTPEPSLVVRKRECHDRPYKARPTPYNFFEQSVKTTARPSHDLMCCIARDTASDGWMSPFLTSAKERSTRGWDCFHGGQETTFARLTPHKERQHFPRRHLILERNGADLSNFRPKRQFALREHIDCDFFFFRSNCPQNATNPGLMPLK